MAILYNSKEKETFMFHDSGFKLWIPKTLIM